MDGYMEIPPINGGNRTIILDYDTYMEQRLALESKCRKYRKKYKRFKRKYLEQKLKQVSIESLIAEFHDYQVEWLTSHNDIEFFKVEWLHQTADLFVKEKINGNGNNC